MDQHVALAGRNWITYSALALIAGLAATVFFLAVAQDEKSAGELFLVALVSLPGITGGIALLKRRSWARILLLVLGFINLASYPPIGTALGGYTIWLLFKRQKTVGYFTR